MYIQIYIFLYYIVCTTRAKLGSTYILGNTVVCQRWSFRPETEPRCMLIRLGAFQGKHDYDNNGASSTLNIEMVYL